MQKTGRDLKYSQKFVVPHTTSQTVTALGSRRLYSCSKTTLSHAPRRPSAQGQTDHTSTGDWRFKQPVTHGGAYGECSTITHNRHLSSCNLSLTRQMMQAIELRVSWHFSEKDVERGIPA
jgi:hypothetical protein